VIVYHGVFTFALLLLFPIIISSAGLWQILSKLHLRGSLCAPESSKRISNLPTTLTILRHLNVGDLVMCWIPGLCKKLHDSWEGPFRVENVLIAVNYKVKELQGKERMKIIHINNAKRYVERERELYTLTVVAEDRG